MEKISKENYKLNEFARNRDMNSQEAVEQLYAFVASIIKKTIHVYDKEMQNDLLLIGIEQSFVALNRYIPEKGNFCTYARHYIKGGVHRYYEKEILHLSTYYASVWMKLNNIYRGNILNGKKICGEELLQVLQKQSGFSRKTIVNTLIQKPLSD